MDRGKELAALYTELLEPMAEANVRLMQAAAVLLGYHGLSVEEAATQLALDPEVLLHALAVDGSFRSLVDSYHAAKGRELEGGVIRQLSEADCELTESAARYIRAVSAIANQSRASERESARLRAKNKRAEDRLQLETAKPTVTVMDAIEGETVAPREIEGNIHTGRLAEDEDDAEE